MMVVVMMMAAAGQAVVEYPASAQLRVTWMKFSVERECSW
jgi:hypothetical protein